MALLSSVATHPQVQKIVAALAADQPYRDISAWTEPKVSPTALFRFKRNALAASGGTWRNTRGTMRNDAQQDRNDAEPKAKQAEHGPIYDMEVVPDGSVAATGAALAAHASPFRGQLEQLRSVTMRSIERAEQAVRIVKDREGNDVVAGADLACIAPLLAQGHRNVELLGKATGELDDRPATTNNLMISLNMPRGD